MKEIYRKDDVIAYDGFRDAFGKKMFVVINTTTSEMKLMAKYQDFESRRRNLDKNGFTYIHIPKYGEVIDITGKTQRKLEDLFPHYRHTQWQICG